MANPWYPNNSPHPPQQPAPGFPNRNPYGQGQTGNPQQYSQYPMQPGRGPMPQHQYPHQQMYAPPGAPAHGPQGPQRQFVQAPPYVQTPPNVVPRGTGPGPNQPYQQARGTYPLMTPPHGQPQSQYPAPGSTSVPSQTSQHASHTAPTHTQAHPGSATGYAHNPPQYADQRMHQPFPGSHAQYYGSGGSIPSLQSFPGPPEMQMHGNRDLPPSSFPSNMSFVSHDDAQNLRSLESSARAAFDSADRDKSGYLDFKEFLDSLRNLDVTIPYHFAMARFAKLDKDKDGRIRESEFVNGYLDDKFQQKSQLKQQVSQVAYNAQQALQFQQHPQHPQHPQQPQQPYNP